MTTSFSLPHLHVVGTNYQIGLAIGKEFEKRIRSYLDDYEDVSKKLLPFTNTEYGAKVVNGFRQRIEDRFPWLIDEMRGLADGSGIPFETILALNLRTELFHLINDKDCEYIVDETLMECSNFSVCNEKSYALLHNEDAITYIYDTGFFVTAKIISTEYKNGLIKSPNEEFTSFTYPGHLAGNAFSFNSAGFTFGVNALYSKQIALSRFPRQIISRLMLSARDLESLERIFLFTPIAFSFSVTVGYFGENLSKLKSTWTSEYYEKNKSSLSNSDQMTIAEAMMKKPIILSYELAPNSTTSEYSLVSKHCTLSQHSNGDALFHSNNNSFISFDYFYHFNHFERIKINEGVVHSSIHRHKRAHEMTPPQTEADLFDFAYDTEDKAYPIYRQKSGDNKPSITCVATALFDLNRKKLTIHYNRSRAAFLTIPLEENELN